MYPDETTLMEVGRVAIAAGRLDAELGALWWHLAPDQIDELAARRKPAVEVRNKIKALARERLEGEHRRALIAFIDEVEAAQLQRNAVLHSRWLLRGPDAMRPVSDYLRLNEAQRVDYLETWEREARASEEWQRQPSDSMGLTDPYHVDELTEVERRLRMATDIAVRWHFAIASMRETGKPAGWQGPPEAMRGPQPIPPGAVVGPAAEALLNRLLGRSDDRSDGT